MELFCWITDESESSFPVDVADGDSGRPEESILIHLPVLMPINSSHLDGNLVWDVEKRC